jgi:hypothetical protein
LLHREGDPVDLCTSFIQRQIALNAVVKSVGPVMLTNEELEVVTREIETADIRVDQVEGGILLTYIGEEG